MWDQSPLEGAETHGQRNLQSSSKRPCINSFFVQSCIASRIVHRERQKMMENTLTACNGSGALKSGETPGGGCIAGVFVGSIVGNLLAAYTTLTRARCGSYGCNLQRKLWNLTALFKCVGRHSGPHRWRQRRTGAGGLKLMNEGYSKDCGASEERRPSQARRAAGTHET